jgi:hypothetical protein
VRAPPPPLPAAQGGNGLAVELTASEPVVPQPLLIPPLSKHAKADWQFTTADARIKLKRLYPQFE